MNDEPSPRSVSGLVVRPLRVLLVDDDPFVAGALARLLREDCFVETALGASEALALLRAGKAYDVILSDVCMPDMSGLDLLAAVQTDLPEMADRVVFMSGGAPWSLQARLEALPNPVLDKPIDMQRLAAALEQVARWKIA